MALPRANTIVVGVVRCPMNNLNRREGSPFRDTSLVTVGLPPWASPLGLKCKPAFQPVPLGVPNFETNMSSESEDMKHSWVSL